MNVVLCTLFGLWCQASPPQSVAYEDHVQLPVEAFGANWHVRNFRRRVLYPDNFSPALERAIAAAALVQQHGPKTVTITFAPRTYRPRAAIDLTGRHDLTFRGPAVLLGLRYFARRSRFKARKSSEPRSCAMRASSACFSAAPSVLCRACCVMTMSQ